MTHLSSLDCLPNIVSDDMMMCDASKDRPNKSIDAFAGVMGKNNDVCSAQFYPNQQIVYVHLYYSITQTVDKISM